MQPLIVTAETLRSAEKFDAAFHLARMEAAMRIWPESEVEIRRFGGLTAIRVGAPFLKSKNRIIGFNFVNVDDLEEVLEFFRQKELPTSLTLPYDGWSVFLFDALVAAGLRSSGSGATPAALPQSVSTVEGVVVRNSPRAEKHDYLELYSHAFRSRSPVSPEQTQFQWIEDSLPTSRRFVAEVDGRPVGIASLAVVGQTACLTMCGTLPDFRGRGVQRALIEARLRAAHEAGCVLALGGAGLFSTPRRNFERCGFAPLLMGMSWAYAPLTHAVMSTRL